MSTITIFLGLLLLVVIYLLLMPIIIVVNTQTHEYSIQLKGLAIARIEAVKKEVLTIKVKVFFMNFKFYPLRRKKTLTRRKQTVKSITKKSRKRIEFRKYIQLLKTFKIKKLFINIDTGDCITNAKLFPLFTFLNQTKGSFKVNFEGRNQMVLHMQNRPINIIKSFIHFKK